MRAVDTALVAALLSTASILVLTEGTKTEEFVFLRFHTNLESFIFPPSSQDDKFGDISIFNEYLFALHLQEKLGSRLGFYFKDNNYQLLKEIEIISVPQFFNIQIYFEEPNMTVVKDFDSGMKARCPNRNPAIYGNCVDKESYVSIVENEFQSFLSTNTYQILSALEQTYILVDSLPDRDGKCREGSSKYAPMTFEEFSPLGETCRKATTLSVQLPYDDYVFIAEEGDEEEFDRMSNKVCIHATLFHDCSCPLTSYFV
jgi:hypothetical protein